MLDGPHAAAVVVEEAAVGLRVAEGEHETVVLSDVANLAAHHGTGGGIGLAVTVVRVEDDDVALPEVRHIAVDVVAVGQRYLVDLALRSAVGFHERQIVVDVSR